YAGDLQRRSHQVLGNVRFIGKINSRFNQRQRLDQLHAPVFSTRTQCASHLAKRKTTLTLRLRQHEIGKTLNSREIKLAVLERPPGELARLGRTQSRNARKRSEDGCNNRTSSMQLELRNIFTRFAVRRRKPKNQRLIDNLAA